MQGRIAAGALTAALVLGLAAPAVAGVSPVNILVSTKVDGNYSKTVEADLENGKKKTFYFLSYNGAPAEQAVSLTGAVESAGLKGQWYRGVKPKKSAKITGAVGGSGFEYDLKIEDARIFSLVVKRDGAGKACMSGFTSAQPSSSNAAATIFFNDVDLCVL